MSKELTPEEKCEAIIGLSYRVNLLQEKDLIDGKRTDKVEQNIKTAQEAISKLCTGEDVVDAFLKKDMLEEMYNSEMILNKK